MTSHSDYARVELEFASSDTNAALALLSSTQRDRLRDYWLDRADGELTTALSFEFMLSDLEQEAIPENILNLARAAIRDEHRHVDWCLRWAHLIDSSSREQAALGGTRPLSFAGASAHDDRLLRTVFGCCFSETVAVHVLLASHAHIELESVKRLNQQHLKEEVGHARLGWALLGWPGLTPRDREMIRAYAPEMTRLVRMLWQSAERTADPELHKLGYLSSPLVAGACEEAMDDVVIPGLERLGVLP
jgi:hypothetical protein